MEAGYGMDGELAPEMTARQTVAALFDDTMDAEQALAALRNAEATERVSLIVRSAAGDERPPVDLAQALVARALDAVGAWLSGLAQLVVPDRGEYLVAGPLGAALTAAGAPTADDAGGVAHAARPETPRPDLVREVLTAFGFGDDEATYLERRLEAGAALLAVTDDRHDAVQDVQRLFADHAAVYLGVARTDERLVKQVEALLADAPRLIPSGGGDHRRRGRAVASRVGSGGAAGGRRVDRAAGARRAGRRGRRHRRRVVRSAGGRGREAGAALPDRRDWGPAWGGSDTGGRAGVDHGHVGRWPRQGRRQRGDDPQRARR
jgi:hypothetical protein